MDGFELILYSGLSRVCKHQLFWGSAKRFCKGGKSPVINDQHSASAGGHVDPVTFTFDLLTSKPVMYGYLDFRSASVHGF